MADEQNQGNTIINQGTTIDNLPGLDGMTPAQKQEFIDSAFVPIRGTISGEMATRKVTGSDLAASGENKIDSISLNGSPVPPVNKNVDLTIDVPYADDDTIYQDDNGVLSVANPLPEGDPHSYNQILYAYSDNTPKWFSVGDGLLIPCRQDTLEPLGTITTYIGNGLQYGGSGEMEVITPVPDPNNVGKPAQAGDVLTYDGDDIFWSDRITLLEARVAALEDALNGNQFSVNGNTPTVNGYTPTINQ